MGQQVELALKESTVRVLGKLATFLPNLLALLVAVGLLALFGAALAFLLKRILTAAKFDERFTRSQAPNVADWAPSHSPTVLIARTAFWACVLLGFIIGISAFDANYAGAQVSYILIPYLTHAVGAFLILLFGTIIARYLARSVLIGAVNARLQYARFLSMGVKWLVLVLTAAMVLDHLQVGGSIVALAFGILFGGIVLTLSLAIGLGSRDLVSRSLERTAPHPTTDDAFDDVIPAPHTTKPAETLRHF
jgi:hypothetical protein